MQIPEDAVLLRIFIGESDRHRHHPPYEAIVWKAREMQLAGATVLRGPMGFGKSSHLHSRWSDGCGLVTLEKTKVIRHRSREKSNKSRSRADPAIRR